MIESILFASRQWPWQTSCNSNQYCGILNACVASNRAIALNMPSRTWAQAVSKQITRPAPWQNSCNSGRRCGMLNACVPSNRAIVLNVGLKFATSHLGQGLRQNQISAFATQRRPSAKSCTRAQARKRDDGGRALNPIYKGADLGS